MTIPIALTIAGSDSSGGAGIQADLKTFAACGVYGASVITALTAQNTRGVTGVHVVPAEFVTAQLEAVFADLDVRAVKVGMVARSDPCRATSLSRPPHLAQVLARPGRIGSIVGRTFGPAPADGPSRQRERA